MTAALCFCGGIIVGATAVLVWLTYGSWDEILDRNWENQYR